MSSDPRAYPYPLRPGVVIEVTLPEDITHAEALRVGRWLATLPLDSPMGALPVASHQLPLGWSWCGGMNGERASRKDEQLAYIFFDRAREKWRGHEPKDGDLFDTTTTPAHGPLLFDTPREAAEAVERIREGGT